MAPQIVAGLIAAAISIGMYFFAMTAPASARLIVQFVPLPLFIAGLAFGPFAAWIALAAAFIGLALTTSFAPALSHAVGFALPVTILTTLANIPALPRLRDPGFSAGDTASLLEVKGHTVGRVLAAAAGIAGVLGCVLVVILASSGSDIVAALKEQLTQELTRSVDASTVPAEGVEQVRQIIEFLLDHIAELAAAGFVLILLGNMALGAWIARLLGRATQPHTDLGRIVLPFWFVIALAVVLGMTMLGGITAELARTTAAPALIVLGITGLAILHEITRGHRFRFAVLMLAYFALFIVGPIAVMIFILLALAEPLTSLRQRSAAPTT